MQTCQICGQQIKTELMYSHRLECKEQLPDPNRPSILESQVIEPTQVRYIQKSQFQQSQVPSIIRQENQLNNFPNDSIIRSYQTKCDFCQLEFPIEIMQEHLDACDEKKSIEQLQFSYYDGPSFIQPPQQHQNQQQQIIQHHENQNDDDYNYNENQYENDDHDDNQNQNYQTVTIQQLGPGGSVLTRIQRRRREQDLNNSEQEEDNQFNDFMRGHLESRLFLSNPFFTRRQHHPMQFLSFLRMMGRQGMQEKDIENLNSIKYVPSSNLSDEHKKCSICITDYEEGEVLILLPCTHRYHSECIGNWLKTSQFCPICKNDIRN